MTNYDPLDFRLRPAVERRERTERLQMLIAGLLCGAIWGVLFVAILKYGTDGLRAVPGF